MNEDAQDLDWYITAVINELRSFAHMWIDGFRRRIRAAPPITLDRPHPAHPLPVGFPFGDSAVSETFEWIYECGREQVRHVHRVAFAFHGRTGPPGAGSSVAWKVLTETGVVLGVFEIAGPIYDDAARPFSIDADVVLEGVAASLGARTPVHLASRVVPVEAADAAAGSRYASAARTPCALRVYELRTPSGYVFRRVGTRWVFPVLAPD
ncbi:hypothetical protein GGX14DRAFT_478191 [Mycena pura]|uniref:Uncharacterized protein n=1 Tax=Mycena pura TaxID=153505 RepID=A0AAD6URX8_9AGAR|nr:hypothetical protein GGX14DRAFT_478191 [Mycena pura]